MTSKQASLVKLHVRNPDTSSVAAASGFEVRSQMVMSTPLLYKRVLEEAKDVTVDVPVPTADADNQDVFEYTLPALAKMIEVDRLNIDLEKLSKEVISALHVNSFSDAPMFELIDRAYKESVGHLPSEHPYYKKHSEMKYRITMSSLNCKGRHDTFDAEAHKALADHKMYDIWDALFTQLSEMETGDPTAVGASIQHQIDKINSFYKKLGDEQRERLRSIKLQVDEESRSLALSDAKLREEQKIYTAPAPKPVILPTLSRDVSNRAQTVKEHRASLTPIAEARRSVFPTFSPAPLQPTVAAEAAFADTPIGGIRRDPNPTAGMSMRDAIAFARAQAQSTLIEEQLSLTPPLPFQLQNQLPHL